uniref:Helicase/UvrB N-terminal domain-containing protein n=1 Tax=Panagrolaimus sp. JU765 TaxID=591449 RepID=A0AC34QA96_9BILA
MALRAKDVGGEFLTSREYQVDIYEHAIKQDSILLMPTGSGKTYISILLMKHMASQLGSDKKTAVFIVDR